MSLAHHSLVAWQRADDLFIRLHQLSLKAFPAYERFELGGQLRRAAFSVAANIVEGFAYPRSQAFEFPQSLARVACRSRLLRSRRAASRLYLGSGCERAGT